MKVCLTGGGTGGSVTPLVALQQEIKNRDKTAEFILIGGKTGPEKNLAKQYRIPFKPIDAGKLRRYFSLNNFTDMVKTTQGYFQARQILKKHQPEVILSAGSYVAVPVVMAGREMRIKTFVHQQDYQKGLANRLMSPLANKITVTFRKSLRDFPKYKTVLTGNPIRQEIFMGSKEQARQQFMLEPKLPTLMVIGGGTGAMALNKLVAGSLDSLLKFCQVVHVSGSGKIISYKDKRYHGFEFLGEDLKDVYQIADLVLTRAGMGVLSELAALGKPTIIIPYPKSHQVDNAKMFEDAAIVFKQDSLNPQKLLAVTKELIFNRDKLSFLSKSIRQVLPQKAAQKIVDLIWQELA